MNRVLIIDDDAAFGGRAVRCLERGGFAARFHQGPFGSLHAIRETGSDIVLVDIDMPRLDGGLLVKMVRDAYGLGQTRVMLTGNRPDHQLAELASSVGADGYVSKLVAEPDLVSRVRSMAIPQAAAAPN
ncbi:MAG TPA: response regulator [Polyangium sp.]|nr:response regulator [Polyangium sp.]